MIKSIMTILIFGGTGSIGTGLTKNLFDQGEPVAIAARRPPTSNELYDLENRVDFYCCDITNPNHVKATIESAQPAQIIHLAAMLIGDCEKNPRQANAVNVAATINILKEAVVAGVDRFIFASSIAVYGGGIGPFEETMDPGARSVYGAGKYYCEILGNRFAKQNNLSFLALRYSGVIGPSKVKGDGMAAARDRVKEIVSGEDIDIDFLSGEECTQYTYIDDAVGATIAALRHPKPSFPVYNVAGPDENCISYKEYYQMIRSLAPNPGTVNFTGPSLRGGGHMVTKRLRDDLGFEPRFTVREALRDEFIKTGILG